MDAVLQRPYNIQAAVDHQLRDKEQAAKRAEAEQRLRDAGVTVVAGPSRYGSWRDVEAKPLTGQGLYGYGTDEVKVDAHAHASEECHAAVVREEGDVILVCTAHKRHRKGGDSQVKTGLTEDQKAERRATIKRNRAAREARDTRTEFLVGQLNRRIPLGELAPQLALQFLHHADGRTLEIACDLIQQATGEKLLDQRSGYWTDYRSLLVAYAERDPDALLRVGAALMFAAPEQQQRLDPPQFSGADLRDHLAFCERRGYQVSEVERTEIARYRPKRRTRPDATEATPQDLASHGHDSAPGQ